MLIIPKILHTSDFYDAPLNYKWTNSIEDGLAERVSNSLFDAVIPLNHKAQMGVALAMSEFILWRLHKFCEKKDIDLSTSFFYVEALWTGIIDIKYAISYPPRIINIDVAKIGGVIGNTDAFLSFISARYFNGSYFAYQHVPSIIKLARHVAPDKDWFDNWTTDSFRRAAELFPAQYDARKMRLKRATYMAMKYDSSAEPPIPRAFFFQPDFDYKSADITAINQEYLNNLNPNNIFLNPTEDMIGQGFRGTPYKGRG